MELANALCSNEKYPCNLSPIAGGMVKTQYSMPTAKCSDCRRGAPPDLSEKRNLFMRKENWESAYQMQNLREFVNIVRYRKRGSLHHVKTDDLDPARRANCATAPLPLRVAGLGIGRGLEFQGYFVDIIPFSLHIW